MKIVIFDLDDTLYSEITYVYSGLDAVAEFFAKMAGVSQEELFSSFVQSLVANGRGSVFDDVLERHGIMTKSNVRKAISIYRKHEPRIALAPEIRNLLLQLGLTKKLYIVTDGNKLVQGRKVEALGLESLVKRVFITHRFGLSASKPSLHCFEIIRKIERCDWSEIAYVGDDPSKDFVALNRVGAMTIRVLQGRCAGVQATREYDARITIHSLDGLTTALEEMAI